MRHSKSQDLVYSENPDVVCVNEMWLNKDISDSEILHSGYTIYRKDRANRAGGGVLIAIKTGSFKSVKEFIVTSSDQQQLEIVSAEVKTAANQTILFCSCYRPPDADLCWMDMFKNFLDQACDQHKNLVISGDFNLPNITWGTTVHASGANDLTFLDLLH